MGRGTQLRYVRPARFRPGRSRPAVEVLTLRIAALVGERQQLRVGAADGVALEQNRLQIVQAQWQLAHALIERHLPQPAAQNAA